MYGRFLRRDGAIISLAALAWWLLAGRSAGTGPLADVSGLATGLLVGASFYFLHEWGHLLAGLAAGGRFELNANLRSPFTFRFDAGASTLAQFVVMSLGGFAVTALAVWVAYGWMPADLLATRVARGVVAVLTALTVGLEVPLLLFGIARGKPPAEAAVTIRHSDGGN